MQWDNIRKSILILLMGGVYYSFWVIWLLFSFYTPSLNHWINPQYFAFYLTVFVVGTCLYFGLTYLTYRLQQHALIQQYMPYFAVAYLGSTLLLAGYSIGISSPATIAGYINLVTVGLVLHERKMIYLTFIPITVALLVVIFLCSNGTFAHAPIFSAELNQQVLYENPYWVFSMMFLYIPIFLAGLGLFEILLTQWRNREHLINEISRKDPLTGIDNRRSIGQSLQQIEAQQLPYAVALLDLDFFKKINDDFGHEAGDAVLIEVAKILKDQIQGLAADVEPMQFKPSQSGTETFNSQSELANPSMQKRKSSVMLQHARTQHLKQDLVGRYGGEEFILIFVDKSLEYVLKMTEACCQAIQQASIATLEGRPLQFTASFGVAFSQQGMAKEDTIRRADQALYQAKHQGRNQVLCYNSSMTLLTQEI